MSSRLQSQHLPTLKAIFPDWADDDLLLVLDESKGSIENAVGKISEGKASQFTTATSRKSNKKITTTSASTSGSPSNTGHKPDNSSFAGRGGFDGGFRGGRGGGRGGRGGAGFASSGRGGLTARGAFRGASTRGGYANSIRPTPSTLNGTFSTTNASVTPSVVAPQLQGVWAKASPNATPSPAASAAVASASPMEDPQDKTDATGEAEGAATAETVPEATHIREAKAEEKEEESNGWLSVAKGRAVVGKTIPKGTKMSWAQIAKPQEKPKSIPLVPAPVVQATPVQSSSPTTEAPSHPPASEPASVSLIAAESTFSLSNQAPSSEDEPITSAPTVSGDNTWGDIPSTSQASTPEEVLEESISKDSTEEEKASIGTSLTGVEDTTPTTPADVDVKNASELAPTSAPAVEPAPVATQPFSNPPPGFDLLPSSPSGTLVESAPKTAVSTARTVNRTNSKLRQFGDEAVVMPGKVAGGFGGIGMQFGSLSLGGDGELYSEEAESPEPTPAPAPVLASEIAQQHAPQPVESIQPQHPIAAPHQYAQANSAMNFFQQPHQQASAPAPAIPASVVSPQVQSQQPQQPQHQHQHQHHYSQQQQLDQQSSYSHAPHNNQNYYRQDTTPSPYYNNQPQLSQTGAITQQPQPGAPPALSQPAQDHSQQYGASPFGMGAGSGLGGYQSYPDSYAMDRNFYDHYSTFTPQRVEAEPAKAPSGQSQNSQVPSQTPQPPVHNQHQSAASAGGYYNAMPPYNPYWANNNPYGYFAQSPAWAQQQQWSRPYPPQPPAPAPAPTGSASGVKPPSQAPGSGPYGHFSAYEEQPSSLGGYSSSNLGQGGLASQYGGIHSFLGGSPAPQVASVQSAGGNNSRPGQSSPETTYKGYQQTPDKQSSQGGQSQPSQSGNQAQTSQQPQQQPQQASSQGGAGAGVQGGSRAGIHQPNSYSSYGGVSAGGVRGGYPGQSIVGGAQQAGQALPPNAYQGQQQQQQQDYNPYYQRQYWQ